MKDHIESIFKVMPYYFARSWRKLHYPEFKTKVVETLYMRTREEVDAYMIRHRNYYKELEEKIASLLRNKVTVISSTHSDGSMILCNYRISVSFDDFIYNEMGKCVVLKCSWSFFDFEKRQQIIVQKYNSSTNVENPDYDSIVNGMKDAIGKFAEYLSKQAELLID